MTNIQIKENTGYKVRRCKKYTAIANGKQYTCYVEPFNYASNFVVTGDGTEGGENIIDTELGQEILLKCLAIYS